MPALDPAVRRRAVAHLRRADPVMADLTRRVGACRLAVDDGDLFGALTESILYQQITGKAAAAIHRRLCALAGCNRPRPEDVETLADADLRAAGLSRQKIAYLRDLVVHVQDGLSLRRVRHLSDEDVIEALTAVRGIGRWTAEMFLIFRLGRLDVLPTGDYGVRKSMQATYRLRELPKPERMRRIAEPWRPYRSVASWYLWQGLEAAARGE